MDNTTNTKTETATQSKVALNSKELEKLIPPKIGAFLSEGTVNKIFPAAKDLKEDDIPKTKSNLEKKLKITNSDSDVDLAYSYLRRLEVYKEMISKSEDLQTLKRKTLQRKDQVARVFNENMSKVFSEQRDLEKTYRQIDYFFYESRINPSDDKVYGVEFINANPDKDFDFLVNSDDKFISHFPTRENFDMRLLTGLICMPDWPGSEAKLVKYGEVAQHMGAHLFTGFPDMEMSDAHELFGPGGDMQDLKSSDTVKQHISVIANPLRIRKANKFEAENGDFFISPAPVLTGKIYKGDVQEGIHIAQANKAHKIELPTPDGSKLDMKWNIKGGEEMKFNKALIPVGAYEGLVFWGVDTLYLASGQGDEGMDQYTVKRCDEYIKKVVLHFLNGQTFVPNDIKSRDNIRAAINRFLMNNTGPGDKMLEMGKVDGVETVKRADGTLDNQAIDIKISVKYKNAVRKLNLYVINDQDAGWKEGEKD
jgi:hypothetical protein